LGLGYLIGISGEEFRLSFDWFLRGIRGISARGEISEISGIGEKHL